MQTQLEKPVAMQARIPNPAMSAPGAMDALLALSKAASRGGVSQKLRDLLNLRASQINGCSVCVHGHARDLQKAGESDERIFAVAAWRDAPFFTEAERAALAMAEAITRVSDRTDPVSDGVWNEATKHFDEPALASLVLSVASVNVWNRLNIATKQIAGAEW
jgi:AhpD family alkylhydroperoxidase